MTPVFFVAYAAMAFIVVMNLFIGIINKYFDEVHDVLARTDWWKRSIPAWGLKGVGLVGATFTTKWFTNRFVARQRWNIVVRG